MNEEKVTTVFRSMQSRLKVAALRLLHGDDDAEDALMETFCRLWSRRKDIQTADDAARLLQVTLKNVSIDMLRRHKLRATSELTPACDQASSALQDDLETRDCFRQVEAIINRHLSPVQQQILRMKEYEGESMHDIALQLKMTEAAVAMQLSRARKTIREQYKNITRQ